MNVFGDVVIRYLVILNFAASIWAGLKVSLEEYFEDAADVGDFREISVSCRCATLPT